MRMSMKTYISRRISFFLAIMFLAVSVYSVSARAASPTISVQNTTSLTGDGFIGDDGTLSLTGMQNKEIVAQLQIINLETPKPGQRLDSRATVLSYDRSFWEIPVIWVDETGAVSYICLPGKNYRPVFAYFVPKNVVVANDLGSDSYTIKLPAFLDGIISDSNVLMVGSESYGITFITTGDLVDILAPSAEDTKNVKDLSSIFVTNNDIVNFFTDGKDRIKSAVESVVVPETTYSAPTESDTDDQENNIRPFKDYVSIHCTQNAIDNIGKDKLQTLLDLIINVIEPQAVYQLNSGFSSYAAGVKEKLFGEEIGLYVYDSEFDKGTDDYDSALAYVYGKYKDTEVTDFGYYIGINVKDLYNKDEETGEYKLDQSELVTLNNTVVHELMHAYMYDYDRTGMVGVVPGDSEVSADDNKFPNWFVEGTASCVDNIYTYGKLLFDSMKDNDLDSYTKESLHTYYSSFYDEKFGCPSIDANNKYYDSDTNLASAYVSGYLAVMYLGYMANEFADTGTYLKNYYDNGTFYYESKAIRLGIDYILDELHEGVCLDDVIKEVSEGKYTSTEDFQNTFLTVDSEGNYDDSYSFCTGILNYLNFATGVVSQNDPDARANGSILLPFDTSKTSVIESTLPSGMGTQEAFVINDEMTFVSSTVDNDEALASAGVKTVGKTEESDQEIIDEEFIKVAKPDNSENDITAEISDKVIGEEESQASEQATDEVTTESSENAQVVEPAESTDNVQAAEPAEATENAQTEETAEVTEDAPAAEISDASEGDKVIEAAGTSDDTQYTETTENTVDSEAADTNEVAADEETAVTDDQESETVKEDELDSEISDIVEDIENTTYSIDAVENTEPTEEKETILLPNLIDTTSQTGEAIEEPGTPNTALETLSEAVAPPASSSSEENSESEEDNGDDGGDGDGNGDSGENPSDDSTSNANNIEE